MTTTKKKHGFASMDPAKQREIASKGGKAAHTKGVGHEWTREEASVAGRKGGLISASRRLPEPRSGEVLARLTDAPPEVLD